MKERGRENKGIRESTWKSEGRSKSDLRGRFTDSDGVAEEKRGRKRKEQKIDGIARV